MFIIFFNIKSVFCAPTENGPIVFLALEVDILILFAELRARMDDMFLHLTSRRRRLRHYSVAFPPSVLCMNGLQHAREDTPDVAEPRTRQMTCCRTSRRRHPHRWPAASPTSCYGRGTTCESPARSLARSPGEGRGRKRVVARRGDRGNGRSWSWMA